MVAEGQISLPAVSRAFRAGARPRARRAPLGSGPGAARNAEIARRIPSCRFTWTKTPATGCCRRSGVSSSEPGAAPAVDATGGSQPLRRQESRSHMLAPMPGPSRVRIGADVGGTFTDVVLQSDSGEVRVSRCSRPRRPTTGPSSTPCATCSAPTTSWPRSCMGRPLRRTRCSRSSGADRDRHDPGLSRRARAAPDADAAPVRLLLEEATAARPAPAALRGRGADVGCG